MAFSNLIRTAGGIVTAGIAVAATGWVLCEEYQKPVGLFSRSTLHARKIKSDRKHRTKVLPSDTPSTSVKRKTLESQAPARFIRARRAHELDNDVGTTFEHDGQPKAFDHGQMSLASPAEPSSLEQYSKSNIVETSDVVMAADEEAEMDSEASDDIEDDVQSTIGLDDYSEESQDNVSGYESSDEEAVDQEEKADYVDNQSAGNSHEDKDEDDSEGEQEDFLEQFGPVMAELDLDKLQQAALMVRLHQLQTQSGQQFTLDQLLELSCKVSPQPMHGAYNLVYRITFSDETTWAARVPGHGISKRWTDLDAKKMDCEYWTMRYIKSNISIPMPEVYYWETSHRIGTPFALMSWVKGEPLFRAWENGLPDQERLAILSRIAGYMSQFQKLSFDRLGMLNFDSNGTFEKVGGEIVLESLGFVPWHETKEFKSHATLLDLLRSMLDEAEKEDMHESHRSDLPLLRLAVESVPDYLGKEMRFALSPADFALQNIHVDPENNFQITGFIDWDGVHAEASSAGYAKYPSWITRDWDPAVYDYNSDADKESLVPAKAGEEDSPAVLSRYRQHYASEFIKLAADFDGYDPRMTTQSHIMDALCIALTNSFCRAPIIDKLLEHAFDGTPPFDASEYLADFEASNTAVKDAMVKQAFTTLWHAEWETPTQIKDDCELSNTDSLVTIATADFSSGGSSNMSSQDDERQDQFCKLAKDASLKSSLQQTEQSPQMFNFQNRPISGLVNQRPLQAIGRSMPADLEHSKGGTVQDLKSQRRTKTWDEDLRRMLTQLDKEMLTSKKATSV